MLQAGRHRSIYCLNKSRLDWESALRDIRDRALRELAVFLDAAGNDLVDEDR
jgi:hypothetical protein